MASRINSMLGGFTGFFGDETTDQQTTCGHNNAMGSAQGRHGGDPSHLQSMNQFATPYEHEDEQDEHDETAEREDLLDQHVAYYMKHHPEVHKKHTLTRIRPGVYNFDGREISVEWHYAEEPGAQGFLIAIDGPLRQPFADYMENNENGIEYDDKRLGRSNLSQIPKGKRMSFGDGNKVYSRLEAMKVAKEQALVREKAAEFSRVGMEVPQHELMSKYKKTISQKLGERRQRRPEAEAPAAEAAPAPQAEAPVAVPPPPPAAEAPPAASPPRKAKQTHGAPKYCAKHNETTKRKKCKPQNLPCSICQTLIQTNYVEFSLCPTCSEKDHRCMCCGNAAVGAPAPSPQARSSKQTPSSPMNARSSPQSSGKSPSAKQPSAMSPMNLFGMPDLFNASVNAPPAGPGPAKTAPSSDPQGGANVLFNQAASAWQGLAQHLPAPAKMMSQQPNGYPSTNPMASASPQNNPYASNNAFVSQNQMPSGSPQNAYASQNAFASYNPMASQSPMASQNMMAGPQRRF